MKRSNHNSKIRFVTEQPLSEEEQSNFFAYNFSEVFRPYFIKSRSLIDLEHR